MKLLLSLAQVSPSLFNIIMILFAFIYLSTMIIRPKGLCISTLLSRPWPAYASPNSPDRALPLAWSGKGLTLNLLLYQPPQTIWLVLLSSLRQPFPALLFSSHANSSAGAIVWAGKGLTQNAQFHQAETDVALVFRNKYKQQRLPNLLIQLLFKLFKINNLYPERLNEIKIDFHMGAQA